MTTTHQPQALIAGDDWEILATLLDENGNPYDLNGSAVIEWILTNGSEQVIDSGDVNIAILDPQAGRCAVLVPSSKTSPLPGGKYTDYLRIVVGGVTSTLSQGSVYVTADPWAAPP